MLINIELKGPLNEEYRTRYDFDQACKIVAGRIDKFGIASRTIVSSFERLITNQMKVISNVALVIRHFLQMLKREIT